MVRYVVDHVKKDPLNYSVGLFLFVLVAVLVIVGGATYTDLTRKPFRYISDTVDEYGNAVYTVPSVINVSESTALLIDVTAAVDKTPYILEVHTSVSLADGGFTVCYIPHAAEPQIILNNIPPTDLTIRRDISACVDRMEEGVSYILEGLVDSGTISDNASYVTTPFQIEK